MVRSEGGKAAAIAMGNKSAIGEQDPTSHVSVQGSFLDSTLEVLPLGSDGCQVWREVLHDLNNALAGIILNTQVMEWKLPSYSRMRRNLHEIERSAQRCRLLLQRLLSCVDSGDSSRSAEADSLGNSAIRGIASCATSDHKDENKE